MKTYTKFLLASLCAAPLTGCAATATDENGALVADVNPEGVICTNEASIGSKLTHRVCTTRAEREEAARFTREENRTSENRRRASGDIEPAKAGD